MKTSDLIRAFRVATDDLEQEYLFKDPEVLEWLSEAEDEAAIRKKLLFEGSDPAMCEIAVEPGIQTYKLHPRWHLVTAAALLNDGCSARDRVPLSLRSREDLDQSWPGWRFDDCRGPRAIALQDGSLEVAGRIERAGVLHLHGYRLPMQPMDLEQRDRGPEIHAVHHRHLIDWALFRAYSVPDTEGLNPGQAQRALDRFEAYFGIRVDGDLRRDATADQPHRNALW